MERWINMGVEMDNTNVIVEISKGDNIKYEYDKSKNMLVCDRVLHTPFKYPFNYGFIPNTLSEDGDPLDAVILMENSLLPGSSIRCKIIGCLHTKDDDGNDPKIIVCPIEKISPICYNTYKKGLEPVLLEKIKYFFQHYKDLEKKHVTIGSYIDDPNEVLEICKKSVKRFYNI